MGRLGGIPPIFPHSDWLYFLRHGINRDYFNCFWLTTELMKHLSTVISSCSFNCLTAESLECQLARKKNRSSELTSPLNHKRVDIHQQLNNLEWLAESWLITAMKIKYV